MELVWKDIEASRLVSLERLVIPVSGVLPAPDGESLSEVLSCDAKVIIESASACFGGAELIGAITFGIIALNDDGRAISFESRASFEHNEDIAEAESGMACSVWAQAASLETAATADGIEFEAEMDVTMLLSQNNGLRVISGVNGASDLEIKSARYSGSQTVKLGSASLRMREELSEPGIAGIISSRGVCTVRETVCDRDGVSVSGVLAVNAVTEDGDGRIGCLARQIPFREKLNINSPSREAVCRAEVISLNIHALGEEFALLAMDAELRFTLYGIDTSEQMIPLDAFSPTIGFDCLGETVRLLSSSAIPGFCTQLRETIELPSGQADIAEVLFPSVYAVVTSTECDAKGVTVSGILATTVVYTTVVGSLMRYNEDVPFSVFVPTEKAYSFARAECACSAELLGSSERAAQLAYSLQLDLELYDVTELTVAAGLAEKELPKPSGKLIVAFASEGEELFDIAKRYSVSTAAVRQLNPDISEPLGEGEKLLIVT